MYDRTYHNKAYTLEASGGLIHSSLVMRDRETDSYWGLMNKKVLAGSLKGTAIIELPVHKKVQWKDWLAEYPNTLVLSVAGKEDTKNHYDRYFNSEEGFRGSSAIDSRLKTKAPIYGFKYQDKFYAVAHSSIEGGKTFQLQSAKIFLYRTPGSEMFQSTAAYILSTQKGFRKSAEGWIDIENDCRFNEATFELSGPGENCAPKLDGFDTFWYNWSLNNPETELLE